jgi:hypothetical protein
MYSIFLVCMLCMCNVQGAKKTAAPVRLPDFNTDVLQDVLKSLDEITSREQLVAKGVDMEKRLRNDLLQKEQPLIPLIIRKLALTLFVESKKLYLAADASSSATSFFSGTPSVSLTMLIRMLQDLSDCDRTQPMTCTYITDGDLVPLVLLLNIMVDRFHYRDITVHIIDLGLSPPTCHISVPRSSSTLGKQPQKKQLLAAAPRDTTKKVRSFQQHIQTDKIAIEYFCDTTAYLSWTKKNQHTISLLFMTGCEPLVSCIHLLPQPQQGQTQTAHVPAVVVNSRNDAIRGNMLVLRSDVAKLSAMTAVVIYPQLTGAPFQLYITTEYVTQPLTEQLRKIVSSCTSMQNCVRALARNQHTAQLRIMTCNDPHISFEAIAQQALQDGGIAYHTLTTSFGVHYLKRYNKQREKKRIMSGTSIPSYRHYFKDRNLTKIWPPEKEPLLTKAPSKKSLKK